MVRFSVLLMSAFCLGICMLSSGLVCMLRGLDLYQKEEAHNAILRLLIGSVLLVFGPVIIAVEDCLRRPCACGNRQCGSRKRPAPQSRQRSQNAPPPRLRRRRV